MRALVKRRPEPGLDLEEVPVSEIGPNDVLIRVQRASICGTDVHIYNWDAWAQKTIPVPMVIGHEFVGVIDQIGSAVRDFGRMLVRDHQNVRAQGRELAKSLNVTPTLPRDFALAKAHVAAMRSLRAARGKAFDRAFLQHEVDFHNAVIDAISKTLLPAIQNVRVKDLVTKVAPAFGAHRDRAQMLLDGLR